MAINVKPSFYIYKTIKNDIGRSVNGRKGKNMNKFIIGLKCRLVPNNKGMELVQVAILIAIAVAVGIIFNKQITSFVNRVFKDLLNAGF